MNLRSLFAVYLVWISLISFRLYHSDLNSKPLKVTTWDAFGYYLYLPKILIYKDLKLGWLNEKDEKYGLTGGWLYQAGKAKNDNYVATYFGGVALMELPFFLIAHSLAPRLGFDADGFSPPYQYALVAGVLIYALWGLLALRRVLLHYFSDVVSAMTVLLLVLASNLMQYISVDSLQCHAFIFPLYCFILLATLRWHQKPTVWRALGIGFICGLATLCRPTELIIALIPLLWQTHNREFAQKKWALVSQNRKHIWFALAAGATIISLQFIYYKAVSGSVFHAPGSKWVFFNPFFRVLFGWEKGWFVYTPVTILFLTGLFIIKNQEFRKSVIWFSILNIWIVIAWFDWHYGASYSARALSHSYPVFALPLAALIEKIYQSKGRFIFPVVVGYLIFVNIFQLAQYNLSVLHFKDMNRLYYSRIYLNSNPKPLDFSLLDTRDWVEKESNFSPKLLAQSDTVSVKAPHNLIFFEKNIPPNAKESFVKMEMQVKVHAGFWTSQISVDLTQRDSILKQQKIRLSRPLSIDSLSNDYAFFFKLPAHSDSLLLRYFFTTNDSNFSATLTKMRITELK